MSIPSILIKMEDETEIRQYLREIGIQSLQRQAGYVPLKCGGTWDDTQKLIDKLPTDHIMAVAYEDSEFIRQLIFSEDYGTLSGIIDKDRV